MNNNYEINSIIEIMYLPPLHLFPSSKNILAINIMELVSNKLCDHLDSKNNKMIIIEFFNYLFIRYLINKNEK